MILQEELTMEEVEALGDSDVVLSQSAEEDHKGKKVFLGIGTKMTLLRDIWFLRLCV